jgi:hypothetical protein
MGVQKEFCGEEEKKEKKEWDKMKDTWQGCDFLFFFKPPTIINYIRTPKSVNPII